VYLNKIILQVKKQIERNKKIRSLEWYKDSDFPQQVPNIFKKALQQDGMSIIAEVKKASPSKGIIDPHFDHLQIAKDYAQAEVDAISVLTEESYFQGSLNYLTEIRQKVKCPLLRKDFMIDSYQFYEARYFGANCVLLVVAILKPTLLEEFLSLASELELNVICEVHNESDLAAALTAGADIIGINNRNLKTFDVSIQTTLNLVGKVPSDKLIISESGIKCREDVKILEDANVDAILVGESLMRSKRKVELIRNLLSR